MLNKQVILASASPRRKELLADLHIPFEIQPASCEEVFDTSLSLEKAIENIAKDKAMDVFKRNSEAIVIGCDTMVCLDGIALGKPKDKEDAYRMLRMLSGRTHQVISGVAIIQDTKEVVFHQISEVTFYELDECLLQAYITSEESYDKAGAYGIQGMGKLLVSDIRGDYFNIVGLPISKVYRYLKDDFKIL